MLQQARASVSSRPARLDQLDAVRGLAALAVVIGHALITFPTIRDRRFTTAPLRLFAIVDRSPIGALWATHEAVLLFFTLSGFVLTLSLARSSAYRAYLVRRVCRIQLPYLAAVVAGIIGWQLVGHAAVDGLVVWPGQGLWEGTLDPGLVVQHVLLVPSFDSARIVPVFWTLVIEMRVSMVFPAIVWMLRRCSWVLGIASAAALSAAAFAIDRRTGVATNYLGTLVYVFPFVVGALVALHLDDVRARLVTTSTPVKAAFVLGAVLMYKPAYLQPIGVLQWGPVNDWLTALATAVLLVAAVESMRFATVLRLRPLRWLGAVSYSLYLLHSIVFLIAVGVLGGQLPNVVVIGLAVVLSLPVAALGHRYLETPARSLGRRLAAAGQVHEGRRTKH
ncbi:MAG: hypothetical protein QOI47_1470 [Actinomycetota bacterium]|nr:hypothetical protein [Actinomycetota bacterium]